MTFIAIIKHLTKCIKTKQAAYAQWPIARVLEWGTSNRLKTVLTRDACQLAIANTIHEYATPAVYNIPPMYCALCYLPDVYDRASMNLQKQLLRPCTACRSNIVTLKCIMPTKIKSSKMHHFVIIIISFPS